MSDNISILVVEDSPVQATHLRRILERNDCIVSVASNGNEALASLGRHKPTMVISDILMPEMDGYELCRRMKADENLKDVPIIILTTLSDPEDVLKGLELGVNSFFTKPYDEALLLSRIQYIVTNQAIRRSVRSEIGIEILFNEKQYLITSDRMQILDLLLSTFETTVQKNRELERTNEELRQALDTMKTLRGLIPICANCKRIRDDRGYWEQVEEYIGKHSDAQFSHGICPECMMKLYKGFGVSSEPAENR